jgi:hypothetical protein
MSPRLITRCRFPLAFSRDFLDLAHVAMLEPLIDLVVVLGLEDVARAGE